MNDRLTFRTAFRGHFTSLMTWDQLSEFWDVVLSQADGWYLYAVGEDPPTRVSTADETRRFVEAVDRLLHDDHREDYCGIVYADSRESPRIIKIFDPNNLGVSCGSSSHPPQPGWVMSRLEPAVLEDRRTLPANRRRWWRSLWATGVVT